ncbi:phosphonate C-P lyase system protein PhnG, partial [Chromobacterium piscinae]|uniref:phosphonate C-P lyase system protein PhnG n=1 Tax=Chromobacterium piscinae TaxID=686831 RepID=UPI003D1589F1
MDTSTRQRWLRALANSPVERLQALLPPALSAAPRWLRRAETGLMMLQGRSGGAGARFNLGEVSVSRATCEINGHVGHGWVRGGDGRHAELIAQADAARLCPPRRADAGVDCAAGSRVGRTPRRPFARRGRQQGRVFHHGAGGMKMLTAFAQPVDDAQQTFRAVLGSMAEPLLPRALPVLPPALPGLKAATAALLYALADQDVSVWLPALPDETVSSLRFHTGMRVADLPEAADFIVIAARMPLPDLMSLKAGSAEYP